MRFWNHILWAGILFFLALASAAHAFNVSSVVDALSEPADAGHEEITLQALLQLAPLLAQSNNNLLLSDPKILGSLDPDFGGQIGNKTISLITRGNYSTDLPRGIYPSYLIPLNDYWGFDANADWNNPKAQDLHFLRDYIDTNTLASAYDTCILSRTRIAQLAVDASRKWLAGETRQALFFLGAATHTIQDSFSAAHTVRAGKEKNNDITAVCYYPDGGAPATLVASEENVCFHESVDPRDYIWLESANTAEIQLTENEWQTRGEKVVPIVDRLSYSPGSESQNTRFEHLKHEARLARSATTKFLFLILSDLSARSANKDLDPDYNGLREKLEKNLFAGNQGIPKIDEVMPNGIMRCEGLSKEPRKLLRPQ